MLPFNEREDIFIQNKTLLYTENNTFKTNFMLASPIKKCILNFCKSLVYNRKPQKLCNINQF